MLSDDYKYGFRSDLNQQIISPGINEDTVKLISESKKEPQWVLEFRLKALKFWQKSKEPNWAMLKIKPINYQAISYLSTVQKPAQTESLTSLKQKWLNEINICLDSKT